MWARVAWFEGSDADAVREAAKEIEASDGPPPGVPSTGITLLLDPETGKNMAIALFKTEADLRQGHETLEGMSPTSDQMRRTAVAFYEVLTDRRL